MLPQLAAMWQILQSTGSRFASFAESWSQALREVRHAQLLLRPAWQLYVVQGLGSPWHGPLAGYHYTESLEDSQGHESERKLERSLLSARISLDVVCLRERETSSKVGRSLGSFDMHCLPSLRPSPALYRDMSE